MNKIIIKHTRVGGREPKDLDLGEIAINTVDGVLFFKSPSGKLHKIYAEPPEATSNFIDQINRYLLFFLLTYWAGATIVIFKFILHKFLPSK